MNGIPEHSRYRVYQASHKASHIALYSNFTRTERPARSDLASPFEASETAALYGGYD